MRQTREAFEAVLKGDADGVRSAVSTALEAGISPTKILNDELVPAMAEVGRLFEIGEYFVPEMLVSARAMQAGVAMLKPLLAETELKGSGRVVIGTVLGDLHDIGKNLVIMMLEGAGFEVVDLGTNVPASKFVEAANGAQIVAMSALLTTTMPQMKSTIDALREAGLRDRVKVIVGGAPVTKDYAGEIGADGYAPDASRAVRTVKELLGL